jgi:DNA-binding SARP family transcriptional activator
LAILALSERRLSRRELASLLFPDANDPLGALRWNLSQLRAAVGPEASVHDDPMALTLRPDASLDVERLTRGSTVDAAETARNAGELLEGLEFGSPPLDSWLLLERRRLAGAVEAALHDGALAWLAAGRVEDATDLARRAVELNPLEEGNQELLIRCLVARGDRTGAARQADACAALFRQELGLDPSPAVRRAAEGPVRLAARSGRRAAARGLLEAGTAAISAGAIEAGLATLREACAEAVRCRDTTLRAETLCALGTALVHSIRGRDDEGAASLHQAARLAEQAGVRRVGASAHRELGYIGVLAARQEAATAHLARAEELAETESERAAVLAVQGMARTDIADYPSAVPPLEKSIELAETAGDRRQVVWSTAMLARLRLMLGELDQAATLADDSFRRCKKERWVAFVPFPEIIRAEVDRLRGHREQAAERFDHAFALGCQLSDPCWEGLAGRGIGLLTADQGQHNEAARWLDEAQMRCARWPDGWEWANAFVLEARVGVAVEAEDPAARELTLKLERLASRGGMRELVARALLHRVQLGEPDLAPALHLIRRESVSPMLKQAIDGVAEPGANLQPLSPRPRRGSRA